MVVRPVAIERSRDLYIISSKNEVNFISISLFCARYYNISGVIWNPVSISYTFAVVSAFRP